MKHMISKHWPLGVFVVGLSAIVVMWATNFWENWLFVVALAMEIVGAVEHFGRISRR